MFSSIYLSELAMCQGVCNQAMILFLAFRGLITGCWHPQPAFCLFQMTTALSRGWTEQTSPTVSGSQGNKMRLSSWKAEGFICYKMVVVLIPECYLSSSNSLHAYIQQPKPGFWKQQGIMQSFCRFFWDTGCRKSHCFRFLVRVICLALLASLLFSQ